MATQAQVERLCPNCGAVTSSPRFCTSCGIDLDMVEAGPATDEAVSASRRGVEGSAGNRPNALQHRVPLGPFRPTVLTLVIAVIVFVILAFGVAGVASRCEAGCGKATEVTKQLEREGISDE